MTNEIRDFQMHPELLYSIIMRQAGSLWKAVIEGVMNSIDASATECKITLTQQMLRIQDNGRGFRDRSEIEQFFEVFGQPHSEKEHKKYGKFRMGRGQLFAFGQNTWRTSVFQMQADIKNSGLKYVLHTNLQPAVGCSVTVMFYEPLTHVQFADTVERIKRGAKYVDVATYLNDEQFNTPPSTQTWDYELQEADIKLRDSGPLRIYNQGIEVCDIESHRFDTGGDVVTKIPVGVNFARNDVMHDCPVWAVIKRALSQRTVQRNTQTRTFLTLGDRDRMANQLLDGAMTYTQMNAAKVFIKACSGRHDSLSAVRNFARGRVTVADRADWTQAVNINRIQSHKLAYVLAEDTLHRFHCNEGCGQLVDKINAHIRVSDHKLVYIPFDSLCSDADAAHTLLTDDELTDKELITLTVLRENQRLLLRTCHLWNGHATAIFRPTTLRNIILGVAKKQAWTDGKTFIAISRNFVTNCRTHPAAWTEYVKLLMHEYLHTERTDKDHEHSAMFFEDFHAWSMGWQSSYFSFNCTVSLSKCATKVRKKLSKAILNKHDAITRSTAVAATEDARVAT